MYHHTQGTLNLVSKQSTLEFELRYQEFIELVKAKKFTEAISYSQKQLIPWQSTRLPEISQVMTLLAFDHRTRCPPYAVSIPYKMIARV
jgi:macrophage erythroblast attacher